MKIRFICLLILFASCSQNPNKQEKISYSLKPSEVTGVWRLFKEKYGNEKNNTRFSFVTNGNILDLKNNKNWFLTSVDNNSIDDSQKTILVTMYNNTPGSYGNYHRGIKTFFISVIKNKQKDCLQLISLEEDKVSVYERIE
jgi:hypothetical protein